MSADFASLGPVCSIDLSSVEGKNIPQQMRIEKVSKALESIFVGHLTSEMGKSIDGSSDSTEGTDGGPYQDFIQQAMSQGLTSGHGLGLAQQIQDYLTRREHPTAAPYMHTALQHAKPTH